MCPFCHHAPIYLHLTYFQGIQLLSNHFHLRHFQWWSMPQKLAFLSQHQKKYFKATLASSKVTPFNFTPDMEFLCLSEALPYLTNATPEIKPRGFLLQSTAPSKGLKRSFRIFSPSLWEQWQDQKSLHFIYLLCASCSLLAHGEEWWPHCTFHVSVLLAGLAKHSSCPGTLGAQRIRSQLPSITHLRLAAVCPCGIKRIHMRNRKFKYCLFTTEYE